MKTTKHAKARAGRSTKSRPRATTDASLGEAAVLAQILAALADLGPANSWERIADRVVPLLKRARQVYPPDQAPVQLTVPPGITVGFGIDLGPAFTHLCASQLGRWGVEITTVLTTALDNLGARIVSEPPTVGSIHGHGTEALVVQAQGWGSALVLAPERLAAIIGSAPRMLITPTRNTLISMPLDIQPDLVEDLWEVFAEGQPDELDGEPMRWTGSAVVGLGEAVVGRAN